MVEDCSWTQFLVPILYIITIYLIYLHIQTPNYMYLCFRFIIFWLLTLSSFLYCFIWRLFTSTSNGAPLHSKSYIHPSFQCSWLFHYYLRLYFVYQKCVRQPIWVITTQLLLLTQSFPYIPSAGYYSEIRPCFWEIYKGYFVPNYHWFLTLESLYPPSPYKCF